MVVDRIESPSRSIPTTLVKDMPFTLEMTCLEKTSMSRALSIGYTMIVSRGLKTPSPLSSDVAYSIIFITSIFLFHLVSPPFATTTTSFLGHHAIGDHLSCRLALPPCLTPTSVSHSNSFRWFRWACFLCCACLCWPWLTRGVVIELHELSWYFEFVMEDLSASMYGNLRRRACDAMTINKELLLCIPYFF
jgi:hypothetical protein